VLKTQICVTRPQCVKYTNVYNGGVTEYRIGYNRIIVIEELSDVCEEAVMTKL